MKLRILVADDNTAFLASLTSALGLSSTSWHRSKMESRPWNCGSRFQPDLVVLDLGTPVLSGIEVTKGLTNRRPGLAVVIYSAEGHPETFDAAQKAGARAMFLGSGLRRI